MFVVQHSSDHYMLFCHNPLPYLAISCKTLFKCLWNKIFYLFRRAFKMMKTGIYFIVIALLVYSRFWCMQIRWLLKLKLSTVVTHHKVPWCVDCDISMATQWAPGPFHSFIHAVFFKNCYLLLFNQWVWANMDITQHKDKKVCLTLEEQKRQF